MKREMQKFLDQYPGAYACTESHNGRINRYYAVCVPFEYGIVQPDVELRKLGFKYCGREWDCNCWEK